jgi:DNA-binding MarR family transcriptional regulator
MALESVHSAMLDALHDKGFDDLEAHHLPVLQYPGPDGLRPSDLAVQLGISKQALNYKLRELERLGYVEMRDDPTDLRSRRIALTERGRAIVPVIRDAVRRTEQAWATPLGEERVEELRAILTDLHAASQL